MKQKTNPEKNKHVPMRRCTGCMVSKPQKELLRIVKSPDGTFTIDTSGRSNGRGAYLCPDISCLEKARKKHGLERSFRGAVDGMVYDELAVILEKKDVLPDG